jgi:hypothetical protein
MVISLTALLLEEISFHRYPRWRDLGIGFCAAVLENVGYRQALAVFQLRGIWATLRKRQAVWGQMTREGFEAPAP